MPPSSEKGGDGSKHSAESVNRSRGVLLLKVMQREHFG